MSAPSPHVLLVEDDRDIRALVTRYLTANDCRVSQAADGREMDRILARARIDMVLLDIMLPGEDGLSICRRLRSSTSLPIIVLSAKGDEIDRVVGLEIGADDYVAKPFSPRELLARMRAVLRRSSAEAGPPPTVARHFRFSGWILDGLTAALTDPQGTQVILTGAEFELLKVFCERPGRTLSRDQLIDLTQGRTSHASERSIDVLVSRLRRKIPLEDGKLDLIRTVRSGGYVMVSDVVVDS